MLKLEEKLKKSHFLAWSGETQLNQSAVAARSVST